MYENSKRRIFRYLAEPRNILAEPLGSAEPRLGITVLDYPFPYKQIIRRNNLTF
jgi:hypothetical protein